MPWHLRPFESRTCQGTLPPVGPTPSSGTKRKPLCECAGCRPRARFKREFHGFRQEDGEEGLPPVTQEGEREAQAGGQEDLDRSSTPPADARGRKEAPRGGAGARGEARRRRAR